VDYYSNRFAVFSAFLAGFFLLFFSLTYSSVQAAEPPINKVNRAVDKIQREQQEKVQRQRQLDQQRSKQTEPQPLPEITPPSLPESGICREINEIVLTGVTLLPADTVKSLVHPYLHKCLYSSDVEKLLADILKAYIDRGYIGVRPYIQAQDLSRGRLEILILEGKVEGFILQDGEKHSINLVTAFPFVEGKPLNLRDIEQGLDQINRLASNNATMAIMPGESPGGSIININNTPTFPLSAYFSLNNLGSPSTGEYQGSATISLDNPFRLNDFITYTRMQTLFEPGREKDSVSDSFFYSLPLGYLTLNLSYSYSTYRTPVPTSFRVLESRGSTETFYGGLNWVVYRDQVQELTANIAVNATSSKNYLEDEFLRVSSRDLSLLDLDLNWNRRFSGFNVNLGLGWSKGQKWFGALEDPANLDGAAPHAQGSKLRITGGVQSSFELYSHIYSFSSQLTGQHAFNPLYGSEYITIGSYYSVRGFNKYSLAGDRGYFVRNELSTILPKLPFWDISLSPFIGLDGGWIVGYKDTDSATLSGGAAGIRFHSKYVTGELSVAQAISVPDTIERESAQFSAAMTLYF